jgi:hypothetical protein
MNRIFLITAIFAAAALALVSYKAVVLPDCSRMNGLTLECVD